MKDAALRVHPYYQNILDFYRESKRPTYDQMTPADARELLRTSLAAAPRQSGLPELETVKEALVPGRDGPVPVRRYRPLGRVKGTCVYLHAGGWVVGDLDTGDAFCRRLADGAGCEVVNVQYGLAPEHGFPGPVYDVLDVVQWLVAQGAGPVVLAGESAGGNLAAAVARLVTESEAVSLAGLFLAYPVTDHQFDTASYRELGDKNLLLSTAEMRWFWDQYCPENRRDDPLASPLRAESLAGMPPTLLCVAQLDPLRSEGLAYAERLAQSGVEVQTRCDPGMLHGYLSAAAAVPLAAAAVHQAVQWVRQQLDRDDARSLEPGTCESGEEAKQDG